MINIVQLYFILLKGTVTAFAGLASLPVLQESLVLHRHVLTDQQLSEAVAITRGTPGPVGIYVVSVGYFVAGIPGAIAGWLAMVTPAFLILPSLHFAGNRGNSPRIKSMLNTIVVASAGLLLAASIPLGQQALTTSLTIAIAAFCLLLLLMTRIEVLWIILGAAAITTIVRAVEVL